jgi:hypothetical protein
MCTLQDLLAGALRERPQVRPRRGDLIHPNGDMINVTLRIYIDVLQHAAATGIDR